MHGPAAVPIPQTQEPITDKPQCPLLLKTASILCTEKKIPTKQYSISEASKKTINLAGDIIIHPFLIPFHSTIMAPSMMTGFTHDFDKVSEDYLISSLTEEQLQASYYQILLLHFTALSRPEQLRALKSPRYLNTTRHLLDIDNSSYRPLVILYQRSIDLCLYSCCILVIMLSVYYPTTRSAF